MKLRSPSWLGGFWLAFLAMGTWMLPAGSMLIPAQSAAYAMAAPTPDESPDELEDEIAELNAYFNAMLADGAFNKPFVSDTRFDLNSDGVAAGITNWRAILEWLKSLCFECT